MTDSQGSLILETGSYMCKSGFSTDESPRINYPLIYGYSKDQTEQNYALNYYGIEAQQNSSSLNLKDIFESGQKMPWELLENFWHSLLFNQFELETIDIPVLTSQFPNSSPAIKEKTCEMFFETFNVPYFWSLPTPVAGIYSSGRINGLVIDCGHMQTSVTPIIEGLALTHAGESSHFGGRNITDYIRQQMGCTWEAARIIKEKSEPSQAELDKDDKSPLNEDPSLNLPDGTVIPKARNVFLKAFEGAFKPDLLGLNFPGLHELAFSSLIKNEFEVRRELVSNVIMIGGNSCFTNFNDRFQRELTQMVPNILKVKIYSQTDRMNSAWNGCAIFASLSNFTSMAITKSEFTEFGTSIIHRKNV